jgi:hypothetical protein
MSGNSPATFALAGCRGRTTTGSSLPSSPRPATSRNGHRSDYERAGGGARGWRCRARRLSWQSKRAGTRWRRPPDGRPSSLPSWHPALLHPDRRRLRQRHHTAHGLGGSTNAVIQLLALAGRAGLDLSLRRFGEPSTRAPVIVNVRPSGEFIVEQLFHFGGIPAVLNELRPLLHSEAATMTGRSIGRNVRGAKASDAQVIRPLSSSQPGRQYHRPVRQPCTGRRGD